MAAQVSRGHVAVHLADALSQNRSSAVRAAAAWLMDTGRGRQAGYLARDVAGVLADRGYVVVRVTTARALSPGARARIEEFVRSHTGARELEIQTQVDPAVIGGARIEIPTGEIDATIRTKLAEFVQGVRE